MILTVRLLGREVLHVTTDPEPAPAGDRHVDGGQVERAEPVSLGFHIPTNPGVDNTEPAYDRER